MKEYKLEMKNQEFLYYVDGVVRINVNQEQIDKAQKFIKENDFVNLINIEINDFEIIDDEWTYEYPVLLVFDDSVVFRAFITDTDYKVEVEIN